MLASCDAGTKVTSAPKDARVALVADGIGDPPPPIRHDPPPPSWAPAARTDPIAHTFASYDAAFRENAYLRYPAVEQSLSLVRAQANGHDYFVERGTHRFWIREGLSWNAKLYGPFAIVNQ